MENKFKREIQFLNKYCIKYYFKKKEENKKQSCKMIRCWLDGGWMIRLVLESISQTAFFISTTGTCKLFELINLSFT